MSDPYPSRQQDADESASQRQALPSAPRWSLVEALLIGVLFIAAMSTVSMLGHLLHVDRYLGRDVAPFVLLPVTDAILIVAIWWLLATRGQAPAALGLHSRRIVRALLLALGGFVLMLPVVWGAAQLNGWIVRSLGITPSEHLLTTALRQRPGAAALVLLFGLGAIVQPAVEELYFRGLLYPALRRHVGVVWAVILNALVFALPHWGQPQMLLPLMLLGVLLASLYAYTRSLPAAIFAHALNNALTIAFILAFLPPRATGL